MPLRYTLVYYSAMDNINGGNAYCLEFPLPPTYQAVSEIAVLIFVGDRLIVSAIALLSCIIMILLSDFG